ncbi:MAG: dTDP-4-dehydrorhamnose 3,5-epimerase [Deltaproteobacteria bacterium]|nr:dTDP-4-dehydrorhamnose 3,5-epimerase [Deltaproteobacteria bacterium]
MIFKETCLTGAYTIELEEHSDERGFFARAWCKKEFMTQGLTSNIVQANFAFTINKGTIRGMHYQIAPNEEAKLMRCIKGAIYDVIIDLRPESSMYKQWFGVELSSENRKMLYVPKGFAHGYQSLTDNVETFYMVSEFYSPDSERAVRWNDPAFSIEWPITKNLTISDKDRNWPDFSEI